MLKKDKVSVQQVILVDKNDNFLGRYAPRHKAHTGRGFHHRAFVCLIFDSKRRVLLQKRKHWLWDGLWDFSAISHTLHLPTRDESYKGATARALKKEMGIVGVKTKKVGGFNYYEKHKKDNGCENEYCAVMVGRYTGRVKPAKEDVYKYKWINFGEFIKDIKRRPRIYTPWATLTVDTLEKGNRLKEFFS